MQISLRSHLIAGVAAVVGASAIAMTPVPQADVHLPAPHVPSVQQIALSGFDNPISELLLSAGVLNTYTFLDAGPVPLPGPWSTLKKTGLIPQIIADGLPIISQLGFNGSDYLYNSVKGLGTSALALSEGFWNATGYLLTLNIPAAINTLSQAIQVAGQAALNSGIYVATGVITRAVAVVTAVAALAPDMITASINRPLVVLGSLVQTVQNTIAALSQPNPAEGAWNAAVNGLFGPTGLPGVLTALTVGVGVPAPAPISAFVPSIRTEISTVVQTIKGALATANPAPPAAAAPAQAPKALAAARNVSAAATDEDQAATSNDNSVGGSSSTPADVKGSGSAGGSSATPGDNSTGSKSVGGSDSPKTGKHSGAAGSKRTTAKSGSNSSE